ncbi:MAG: transcription antitermination factor NusB [Actinomycetota bacterium]|nr:transcription antitermination factor NusB [Actinomycetota bacterium]
MAARSKARKRALDLLFEADQRGLNVTDLLAARLVEPGAPSPVTPYTVDLVEGVVEKWADIDDLLTTYSQGWTVERMPGVDRAILRIGAWEVVWNDDVPDAVAISEAVALAKSLSTDDSPSFVNGLLGRLAEVKPTLV